MEPAIGEMTDEQIRDRWDIPEPSEVEVAILKKLFAIHRMLSKETWGVLNNLLRRNLSGTDTQANRIRELTYAGASPEFIEWFTTHEGESTDGR